MHTSVLFVTCSVPLLFPPAFLGFLFASSLFKMPLNRSTEVLSSVSKCKKAVMRLMEKRCVLDKRRAGMCYSAVDCELMVMTEGYIVNKLSLNRNTEQSYLLIG